MRNRTAFLGRTPTASVATTESGWDYRLGYSLGLLEREDAVPYFRPPHRNRPDPRQDLPLRAMPVTHQTPTARLGPMIVIARQHTAREHDRPRSRTPRVKGVRLYSVTGCGQGRFPGCPGQKAQRHPESSASCGPNASRWPGRWLQRAPNRNSPSGSGRFHCAARSSWRSPGARSARSD